MPMATLADEVITPVGGAEVVTGSSRMKAGTVQKLVLNMLTTGAMIRVGKVYGNLMVDVEATNAKLVERQKNIVMQATECSRDEAEHALNKAIDSIGFYLFDCNVWEHEAKTEIDSKFRSVNDYLTRFDSHSEELRIKKREANK